MVLGGGFRWPGLESVNIELVRGEMAGAALHGHIGHDAKAWIPMEVTPVRKRLSPVILHESWDEGPEDEGYLCERVFSEVPFGAAGSIWATVYDLTIRETYFGVFSEDIGNVFYIRVCSPGFDESDDRFKDKWRVEMDDFDDAEIRRKIIDYVEGIRGVFLLKDPVEALATAVYCEEF